MEKPIPVSFQAVIYEKQNVTNFADNSGFTKCRCRVFYKGENANGSYITDEFANKVIESAAGAPIVGLWDPEKKDFTTHKKAPNRRGYGFVSQTPNFEWEEFTDDSGEMHEYATFDVVLWTSVFKEAEHIIGAPLSMELNANTLEGEWVLVSLGSRHEVFQFKEGELLGLCVLGRDVEPCFEGAAFFDKDDEVLATSLKEYILSEISAEKARVKREETVMKEEEKNSTEFKETSEEIRSEEVKLEPTDTDIETSKDFDKVTTTTHTEETTEIESEDKNEHGYVETIVVDKVQTWEAKEIEYQAQISKLTKENEELREYKKQSEQREKSLVIKQFENVLTTAEIEAVKVEEFSAEQLKEKFGAMAYEKISANTSMKKIHSEFVNNTKNDTIDNIVRSYKGE